MNGHQVNEERSLWLHRAVADKLLSDPEVLERARCRVERWIADGSVHSRYAEAWRHLLTEPPEEISRRLVDVGEKMYALRQCSPFAGALDPRERWRILRRFQEALGTAGVSPASGRAHQSPRPAVDRAARGDARQLSGCSRLGQP